MEDYLPLLWLLFVIGVALIVVGLRVRQVIIYPYERGLLYRSGRYQRSLPAGSYWIFPPMQSITKVDTRWQMASIQSQELLSADQIGLRLSLVASYRVVDALAALHENENYASAFYMGLQVTLRDLVGAQAMDDLLARRQELAAQLKEAAIPLAKALGLELGMLGIRDIMLPGEIKNIYAQVVNARKEGQAALERARGEQAALRSLANSAQLLADHPHLYELRVLQTLQASKGHTVILNVGGEAGAEALKIKTAERRESKDSKKHG